MDLPSYYGHQNGHMAVGGGGGNLWRRPQAQQPQHYGTNGAMPHQDSYQSSADLLRDFPTMRPSSGFSEQQALMRVWYKAWSPAERLVSLSGMVDQLSDTQMTLLRNILQARLQHKPGLLMKEARANKPEVVYRECSVSPPEQALDFLQDHLPLLALTNHEAKPLYLNGVLRAVRAALKAGGPARVEQARQLLGLLAVHPVLTRDDKRVVHSLFAEFAEACGAGEPAAASRSSPDRRAGAGGGLLLADQRRHSACAAFSGELPGPAGPASPAFSPPQDGGWQGRNLLSPSHMSESSYSPEQQQQQRLRSNSLTPPGTYGPAGDLTPGDLLMTKPRSSSIHLDHSPLGPGPPPASGAAVSTAGQPPAAPCRAQQSPAPVKKQLSGGYPHRSSSHSSLSDVCRDKAFSVRGSGTTTVPKWLHKLRLHKYTWIFAGMTYEDLFDVTMEKLLSLGVTQGGANKLLRNIQELNDRPQKLRELEQGLAENKMALSGALEVMQVMVVSPMRAHKPRLAPSPTPPSTSAAGTPLIRVTRSDDSDQEPAAGADSDSAAAAAAETDLQALITRVLAKMCTQLLVTQSADDEAIQTFLWVLDEATWHEAFTDAQRRKFVTWKRQISLELGRRQVFPTTFRRHSDARQYHSQRRHSDARGYRRFPAPSTVGRASPVPPAAFSAGYPAPSIGYWGAAPAGGQPAAGGGRGRVAASLSPAPLGLSFPRRTSLQESVLEVPTMSGLYRTNSGDIYRPAAASPFSGPPPPTTYGSGRLAAPLQPIPAAGPPPPPAPAPPPPAPPPPPPPPTPERVGRMDSLESMCRSVCETALK